MYFKDIQIANRLHDIILKREYVEFVDTDGFRRRGVCRAFVLEDGNYAHFPSTESLVWISDIFEHFYQFDELFDAAKRDLFWVRNSDRELMPLEFSD